MNLRMPVVFSLVSLLALTACGGAGAGGPNTGSPSEGETNGATGAAGAANGYGAAGQGNGYAGAAGAANGAAGSTNGAAGAAGAAGSTNGAAEPAQLLGTWQALNEVPSDAYKFTSDGTCIYKLWGDAAVPCSYSAATGGVNSPSASQSWIVQVSTSEFSITLDVVAIDSKAMTVRDGQNLWTYSRTSDDDVKDCVGPDQPPDCDTLTTQSGCQDVPGCNWSGSCGASSDCYGLDQDSCQDAPGCQWNFAVYNAACVDNTACTYANDEQHCSGSVGCSWTGQCGGTATPCIELSAADCAASAQCHLQ